LSIGLTAYDINVVYMTVDKQPCTIIQFVLYYLWFADVKARTSRQTCARAAGSVSPYSPS